MRSFLRLSSDFQTFGEWLPNRRTNRCARQAEATAFPLFWRKSSELAVEFRDHANACTKAAAHPGIEIWRTAPWQKKTPVREVFFRRQNVSRARTRICAGRIPPSLLDRYRAASGNRVQGRCGIYILTSKILN